VWTVIVVCDTPTSLFTNTILTIIDNRADHTGINDQNLGTARDYGTGTGTGTTATGTTSTTTGPHKSSIMNKLDPRVDSDATATHATPSSVTHGTESGIAGAGTTHTGAQSGTHGLGGTTTGTHSSTLGSGTHGTSQPLTGATGTTNTGSSSTTAGPHSSNIANKADPRVDSDRDNRARQETLGTGAGHGTTHSIGSTTHGTTSTNVGPHDSNIANKLDPRVDSDRDNRARHETLGTGASHGTTHGIGSTTHGTTSTNVGPHDSNIANKADPRVDSDRDNRARHETLGTGASHGTSHGIGSTTHGTTSTNVGPHDSNIANKLDPRVDSDRDNRGRHETLGTGASHGTSHGIGSTTHGTTSTNVGPHDSNIANKVDPRVDSDRDNRALLSGAGTAPALGSTDGPTSTLSSGTATGHAQPLSGATHGTSTSTNAGPHDSNIANKLDPRVDSDLDTRAAHQSLSGTGAGTVNHGTHTRGTEGLGSQDLAGSSYNTPAGTAGRTSGTTATAGPHDSSIANKLDPRVESDVTGTQRTI
jgi:hypothetical protein